MIRAYLVDDEPLALRRLERLLSTSANIEVAGSSADPAQALEEIRELKPDALFLDIQMPEMTGFDLLANLGSAQPLVVFTTAYDQYALRAFEVNSIDYLLKPVEKPQLERALKKLERILGGEAPRPPLEALLVQVTAALDAQKTAATLERIPSRSGERVHLLDLTSITHFFAEDKLTYAATAEKNWVVDRTIADLEQMLNPKHFVRVHRSTIVNLNFVDELHPWFGGRMIVRLKTPQRTEITVSRDRLKDLKDRLGL
jgi:two-component system LytT family response regulator